MIVFSLVVIALVALGTHFARILWHRLDPAGARETPAAEMIAAGALIGVAAWLAVNWLLALTHGLNAVTLWICVGVVLAGAIFVLKQQAPALTGLQIGNETLGWLAFLLPAVLWLIFILWRGLVLPPASHDVLAYHLPKAVLLERAGGWELFQAPDPRIAKFPFNYELLLADILILGDTDAYTEWIGTVSWLLLLIATAALARRWWGSSVPATVAAVLVVASTPVLILHSGADKNDLLVAWLSVCALLWGSRWVVRGGRVPMLLTIVALGVGLGTKTTIVATGAALAPFFLVRAIRERKHGARMRDLAWALGAALLILVFGGGFTHFVNLLHVPQAADLTRAGETAKQLTSIAWGDWGNLWKVPYLLLTVPFSTNPSGVWAPWDGRHWFWPHYEIYFSHYGRLFSLLLLALPFVLWKFGARADSRMRAEWKVAGIACLVALALMLPTVFRPLGFFGAMARYFVFIVPIVAALVVPPMIDAVMNISRRLAAAILAMLALLFCFEASIYATNDRFAPLDYALWAAEHPGTRFIYFHYNRAGSVVDRLAGPRDKIAVDGAFDTWVYPAYGSRRTRPVVFLPQDVAPDAIPADARWVIIDRSWNALWSNPKFENMSQMWEYIGRGKATDADTRLLRALAKDRRFRLVFADPRLNQAVFLRVE